MSLFFKYEQFTVIARDFRKVLVIPSVLQPRPLIINRIVGSFVTYSIKLCFRDYKKGVNIQLNRQKRIEKIIVSLFQFLIQLNCLLRIKQFSIDTSVSICVGAEIITKSCRMFCHLFTILYFSLCSGTIRLSLNPLNTELNPICQ